MTNNEILDKVCGCINVLVEAAERHQGLFPAILDLRTHQIPDELPPKLGGQRNEDRSFPGCNLLHDMAQVAADTDSTR